ncbi:MAG: MFS transporter [Lachnospiraceae bacterium]|nr:MFS transporter [Lachnospiraceae bacterium]
MSKQNNSKPISKSLKTFYGVGDFSFTLMTNIDTFYASFFFTNIAKFSLGIVSIMTTISAVVDAILSMMYGAFLNKVKAPKWGRYRSWFIITPWLVPFLYACQFIKIGNGAAAIIFATLAMITSRIAWNIPYIANISMINVAGKTQDDRMALSSIRSVWTSLGSVVYSFVGPAVVAFFAAKIGESNAYAATAFVFGVLMAAAFYAHFVMFKGYEPTGAEEAAMMAKMAKTASADAPKVKAMDAVKCNPHLIWLIVSNMTKYVLLFLVNGMAMYYFTYVSQNPGLMTPFMLIANVLGIVASFLARPIVAKLNPKRTVLISYVIMAVAGILAFFMFSNTTIVIVLISVMFFFMYITNAADPDFYANCARYSGEKLGYDVTGTVMGLLTVPIKLGIVARGLLISACLAIAGFDASVDYLAAGNEALLEGIQRGVCYGFMVIPAVAIFFGALTLAFGYRLGGENK